MTYPVVDLALVAATDGADVLLDHTRELVTVVDLVDPAGELRVPDKGVATDGLVALGGPVDEVVSLAPVVLALAGVETLPLHAVLGSDLTEVGLDNGGVPASLKTALIGGSAIELLALGLEERVDALGSLTVLDGGSR